MKHTVKSLLTFALIAGFPLASNAQERQDKRWENWDLTVGLGAEYEPVSPGVDKYEVDALPMIEAVYKDRYFIGTRRGIGGYIFKSDDDPEYGIGLALGYDGGREESDARTELDGLGDIDGSAEAVLFAEGEVGPVELEFEIAHGLNSDGHDGVRAELGASMDYNVSERFQIEAGPFLTYGDSNYIQSYYGVSSQQAARSNTYSQYDASGGFESYGLEISTNYAFTDNIFFMGGVEYTRLMGDAKDSPIVDNEGYFSAMTGVAYRF